MRFEDAFLEQLAVVFEVVDGLLVDLCRASHVLQLALQPGHGGLDGLALLLQVGRGVLRRAQPPTERLAQLGEAQQLLGQLLPLLLPLLPPPTIRTQGHIQVSRVIIWLYTLFGDLC